MTTVVVADDDRDICELVSFKLAQAGFEVITVNDGPSALAAVRREMPDLAILDLTMPGMTGLEVCAALREDDATAGVPVILLTAKAQERDVTAGFSAGADDYVVKPFSPRELVARAQAVLARTEASA